MRTWFPSIASKALPSDPRELARSVDTAISAGAFADGYVRIDSTGGESFIFFLRGKVHSAGAVEDGRFVSRTIADAVREPGEAELCSTDLALLLCIAVLFRKAPAVQIAVETLSADVLLDVLKQSGVDSVVLARRAEKMSLLFCRNGVPVELFPAPGEPVPEAHNVAQRLVVYATKHPDLVLDVYEDVRLGPTKDAGQPLSSYVDAAPPPTDLPRLLVKLGSRVVFRWDLTSDFGTVGRGENDLTLDNLSVSRRHARFRRLGEKLVFEDLGSENGLVFKGNKCGRAEIGPGDELGVGKYTLVWAKKGSREESEGNAAPAPVASKSGAALHETIAVSGKDASAAGIEHEGTLHKIRGLIFAIGKAPDAQLRIRGLFIARTHVRIFRDPNGTYTATHVGGLRAMRVNEVKATSAKLKDGDVIAIGGQRLTFRVIDSRVSSIGPARRL